MKKALVIILFFSFQLAHSQAFNPWLMPEDEAEIKAAYWRQVLNMFSLGVQAGYSHTNFTQDLSAFSLYTVDNRVYLVNAQEALNPMNFSATRNWLNAPILENELFYLNQNIYLPEAPIDNPVDNPFLANNGTFIHNDTASVIMSAYTPGVPVSVYLTFDYQRLVRIGVGASFEFQSAPKLISSDYDLLLPAYQADYNLNLLRKYYGSLAYRYHKWWDYSFVIDTRIGRYQMGNNFDPALTAYSTYLNFGLPIEKNVSEYYRLIIRPSFDWKSFDTGMPEGSAVSTNLWSINLEVGIELSYPKYRKCWINACKAQPEHTHFGKRYRGQTIFKKQNPKIGQLHKGDPHLQKSTFEKVKSKIGRIFDRKPRAYSSNLFKLRN